jgi:hypothetical protein
VVPNLLQAVGLVELAHQVGVSRVNEAGGLAALDCLGEGAVEESFLIIQLVNEPTLREN